MANRNTTQLGAPGPRPLSVRPLGAPQTVGPQANGAGQPAPAGTTSMTLGTLRAVRGELASLGALFDRMSDEMANLRRAVETLAEHGGDGPGKTSDQAPGPEAREAVAKAARKAAKRAKKREAARAEREAALEARVDDLEDDLAELRRRVEWMG